MNRQNKGQNYLNKSSPSTATKPCAKVLFITRKWPPAVGGMETYSQEMVQELSAIGHEVEVIALPGRQDGSAPGVLALVAFGVWNWLRLLIRRNPGDVVFGGDLAVWPLVWAACMASSARPVLSAHGTDISLAARNDLKGRTYALYLAIGRWLLGSNLLVIANSKATEDRVRNAGFGQTAIVPLGCRVEVGAPAPGLQRTLLFAGRIVTRKGLSWFVHEVLPALPEDIRLAVAGTKWDQRETAALDDPRVDFLGPLSQAHLHRHMAGALAVVIPNIRSGLHQFEGFGLIAAEAAAAGGIVLAARLDGYETSVIGGETGTLLEPQKSEDWVYAICELANLPKAELLDRRARAKEVAKRKFDWSKTAAETADCFAIKAE